MRICFFSDIHGNGAAFDAFQQRDGKGTSYVIFDTQKRIFRIQSFAYDCKVVEQQIEEYEKNTPDMTKKLKEVLYRRAW